MCREIVSTADIRGFQRRPEPNLSIDDMTLHDILVHLADADNGLTGYDEDTIQLLRERRDYFYRTSRDIEM